MKKAYLQSIILFATFSVGVVVSPYLMKSMGASQEVIKKRKVKYWVAPMDPKFRSDKPGKSPMGMALVPVYEQEDQSIPKKRRIKYWVAPMDPKFRSDKPGKSPMGMDLVPIYAESGNSAEDSSVKISPRVINNLGVVTYKATYQNLSKQIDTVGYVKANENNIENVHSYTDGWVRNLKVNTVGANVKKGQVLFELFSPTLVNAQQELLLAINSNNQSLVKAGKEKLITLGLNTTQIEKIIRSKKPEKQIQIFSKSSGIVSKLNVRDGMYIKPDSMLMVIDDLRSVWVQVEVYEKESNWVKLNQVAVTQFPGLPGMQWQGEVIYVYPTLNKITHTLPVRLKFPNPDLTLKPNMYASVKIFVPNIEKQLVIPQRAVIPTGKGAHVIIALGNGRFRPQSVTLGYSSGNMVSIISGLRKGDQVVSSGQFLIDSESNLNASFERVDPNRKENTDRHSMMNMQKDKEMSLKEGEILAINRDKKMITIRHQPIKKLGMLTMVMEVSIDEKVSFKQYKVGQCITFRMKSMGNNRYKIIEIHALNSSLKTN